MAMQCPARACATAQWLMRSRRPLSDWASHGSLPLAAISGCSAARAPSQHVSAVARDAAKADTGRHRLYCCSSAASARRRRHLTAVAHAPAAGAAAGFGCAVPVRRQQRRCAVMAAAAAANAASALAAPGSTTVTAEELVAAHLAAIDSNRSKAYAIPDGGIPLEWAALEPLPPNTKPPAGEQNAHARRAIWRIQNHKEPFCCPACRQPIYKREVLGRHLRGCCPDLLSHQELAAADGDNEPLLRQALRAAALREAALQHDAMDLGFRQVDAEGRPIRRTAAQVAAILQLPEKRTRKLLRLAMKAIPLRHDAEPLEILFEDDHLLALNKPPGVLTAPKHRYMGGSMVNRIIPYLGRMPHVLHRLDMYTSGVVVFGKTLQATRHVHAQFRKRTVQKRYLALVAGVPESAEFVVDAPIDRHPVDKLVRITTSPDGLLSSTAFSVLASNAGAGLSTGRHGQFIAAAGAPDRGAALVSCAPLTGRTHQIRVHLGHVGHPILGDDFYGVLGPWIGRQALHAAELGIDHPATGERIHFSAPPLEDFRSAMVALGLQEWQLEGHKT